MKYLWYIIVVVATTHVYYLSCIGLSKANFSLRDVKQEEEGKSYSFTYKKSYMHIGVYICIAFKVYWTVFRNS